jgi:citronellol/citronellal dehydrogenase
MKASRTPEILADAAHMIFTTPSKELTGQFLIDDTFMHARGITGFDKYRVDPTQDLAPDFFVPADSRPPVSLKKVT